MRIVVLAGGTSTERDVSISSGLLVASALRKKGHLVVLLDVFTGYEKDILDVDELFKQNYSFTDTAKVGETISDIDEIRENRRDKTNRFIGENVIDICACADITFFALHGGEGENGQLQATFDLLGLKYTGSGYLGSALAMNKGLTKSVLIQNKVLTPRGEIFKSVEETDSWKIFPCVVKPCSGGSSVGITIAKSSSSNTSRAENLRSALSAARRFRPLKSFPKRAFTTTKPNIRQAPPPRFALPTSRPSRTAPCARRRWRPSRRCTSKATRVWTLFLTRATTPTAWKPTHCPA